MTAKRLDNFSVIRKMQIAVTAWSKMQVCGLLLAASAGSNPAGGKDV
jgi:hypothetical protein